MSTKGAESLSRRMWKVLANVLRLKHLTIIPSFILIHDVVFQQQPTTSTNKRRLQRTERL